MSPEPLARAALPGGGSRNVDVIGALGGGLDHRTPQQSRLQSQVSSFFFLLLLCPSSLLSLVFSFITCPLLSSPLYSLSSYLDYRFPSPSCSSRLSFLTILLFFSSFLSSFLFLLLYRHKSFVNANVNITYVAGLSPSLSLFLTIIFFHHRHYPVQPFTPPSRLFSPYFLFTPSFPSYIFLTPFSTILIPFSPFLSPPSTSPRTQPSSLSPFPPAPTESLDESTKKSY